MIEILIGSVTLLSNLIFIAASINHKPPNVLLFVVVSAIISTLIGVGILKFKLAAYRLLLYFSSVVIFSKLMAALGIIEFAGTLPAPVPAFVRDWISLVYHGFVIYYLLHPGVKKIFHR